MIFMRVAVLADCHIDHRSHGLDAFGAWRRACKWVTGHEVDVAVIAGDMFHTGHADGVAINRAMRGLNHITKAGIPVLIVIGNHEWIDAQSPSGSVRRTLQAEAFDCMPGVKVCTEPGIVAIPNTDLRIAALPWPKPGEGHLAQAEAAGRMAEALSDNGPNLCVAHAAVEGATVITKRGSERDLWGVTGEPVTPLEAIDIPEIFGHTSVGHIHRRQNLSPTCSYVGSNEAFTFADEGQAKGFSILDLDGSTGRWHEQQVVVGDHHFVTVEVGGDMEQLPEHAIVRLIVPDETPNEQVIEVKHTLNERGMQLGRIDYEADKPDMSDISPDVFCDGQLAHGGIQPSDLMDIWYDRKNLPKEDRTAVTDLMNKVFVTI